MILSTLFLSAALATAPDAPSPDLEWDREVEVEFIVDGSGSMAGQVDGQSKMSGAKTALGAILRAIPENIAASDMGLRIYGHRTHKAKKDCNDTHLEVPISGIDKTGMIRSLGAVQPTGQTPIALSLEMAAKDFKKKGDRIVVLVTDGIESCDGDPCATSAQLTKSGAFTKVYAVGFAVNEEEKAKLSCIGEYIDARSTDDLQRVLNDIIEKAVIAARVEVKATFNGRPVPSTAIAAMVKNAKGTLRPIAAGKAVRLPAGEYEVEVQQRVDTKCGSITAPVKVGEGAVTRVVAAFGRGELKFTIPDGEKHGNDLRLTGMEIYAAGKLGAEPPMLKGKAIQTAVLCAGKYDLRFTHPQRGESELKAYEIKADSKATLTIFGK